jgi:hypothetical protein
MPALELTVQQWRYLSVLLANEVRKEATLGLVRLAGVHRELWVLLQPVCEWDEEAE